MEMCQNGAEYLKLNGSCGMRYVFIYGSVLNVPKQIPNPYHLNTLAPDVVLKSESAMEDEDTLSSANVGLHLGINVCGNVISS